MRFAATPVRSFLVALACSAVIPSVARASDTTPPVIQHTPVTRLTRGENLFIMATMKDDSAIFGATLWYRAPNTLVYSSKEMIRKGEDLWGAQIPTTTDIEYYIEAYDEFGNGPSWSGSPKTPFTVHVVDPAPVVKKEEVPEKQVEEFSRTDKSTSPDLDDLSLPSSSTKKTAPKNDDDLSEPVHAIRDNVAKPTPFDPPDPVPVYKQWWFIGGVSVMSVAAITTIVILLQPQQVDRNVFGTGLRTQ